MIFLSCLLSFYHANSQVRSGDSLISSNPPIIEAKRLTGIWISADSLFEKIEFTEDWHELVLKIPGDHSYFFLKDSLGNVSSSGFYPQWPPPSCNLIFISQDTLKVSYDPFYGQGISVLYVKSKP